MINEKSIVSKVISILKEKKAQNVSIIDISEVLPVADYFIIATIESMNQANSILFEIEKQMKNLGLNQINRKEKTQTDWILSDYNIFVLHLFTEEKRKFYQLENLWNKYKIDVNQFENADNIKYEDKK